MDTEADLITSVVPSGMNPVAAKGDIFSALFDKIPAKRAGKEEDIVAAVRYLAIQAGVRRRT